MVCEGVGVRKFSAQQPADRRRPTKDLLTTFSCHARGRAPPRAWFQKRRTCHDQ